MRLWGIRMSAISQEMLKMYVIDMSFKITDLRLQMHFPGANKQLYAYTI